jgi:hypothetical protein
MSVKHNPSGTPLPDDHPLKGGCIIFGWNRPPSSAKPSEPTAEPSYSIEPDEFDFCPQKIADDFAESHPQFCSQWRQAAIRTQQADPFCCTPCWQLSFHYAFSPHRRIFYVEQAGNVVALAEKVFSQNDVVLTPLEPHWLFGSPLLGPGSEKILYELLPSIAKRYGNHMPRLLLSGVRPGGTRAGRIISKFKARFGISRLASDMQCAASLAGGFDGFLSRRSCGFRKNMKKTQARAARTGITYERMSPTSREECVNIFDRMYAIELKSWKGINQCGLNQEPATTFYKMLLCNMAVSSDARVVIAQHDGVDIGYIFGGLAGRVYRGQQFSYDDKWGCYAVGNLLQYEQIRWLCEERARRYDMGPIMGSKVQYKERWTEKKYPITALMLRAKS